MTAEPEGRFSQLLRGALDLCLLGLISREPVYGYEMVRRLEEHGLTLVSEGSIYPALSRLQRHGLVEGFHVPSGDGPARKYYRLTPSGADALARWRDEWHGFAAAVDSVTAPTEPTARRSRRAG